jgi:hypothetical protein
VQLDYPVGGETFYVGEIVTVQWHILVQHNQEDWDLYFSSDGGMTYDPVVLDLPVEQLEYDWTVPDVLTEQGRIKIVQDNVGIDYSDSSGNFTIEEGATSAHGGELSPGAPVLAIRPNPFRRATTISYQLPTAGPVELVVYDRTGRRVRTLVGESRPAGSYSIEWDGRDDAGRSVMGGAYVCRLTADSASETRELILLR